jgi:hypothetical protein
LFSVTVQTQFYFGRNKIQYDQFRWETLKTDHFDIYFYPEEQDVAETAAGIAEKTYREFTDLFQYEPENPIPLIIYATPIQFRQTNVLPNQIPEGVGGFFEFIKGRVVLPYNGRLWDFYHVIRHELVHVFMNKKVADTLKVKKRWNANPIPLWFTEGLAEWWSIGWDSQTEMILRDAVLHENLKPLHQTTGFLLYKEGQAFLRFFQNRFGKDAILTLLDSYWESEDFETALGKIAGSPYRDLLQEWSLSLKKEFSASLESEHLPPSGKTLLTTGRISSSPAVFKQGDSVRTVVYLSNREGFTNVYRQSLSGKKSTLVLRGERKPEYESLHILQSKIAANWKGQLVLPAFRRGRDALVVLDVQTGKERAELIRKDLVSIRSADWSPDGERIIFSASRFSGWNDLYLWDLKANTVVRLTSDRYADWDPVFSPDGNKILFSSDRNNPGISPAMDIFLLDLQTGEILSLTHDPFTATNPHWDPVHSNRIYFLSDRSTVNNIWMMNPGNDQLNTDKSEIFQVTHYHTGVTDFQPVNSDSMVMVLFQDYGFRIHYLGLEQPSPVQSVVFKDSSEWAPAQPESLQVTEKPVPYKLKYTFDIAQTAIAFDPQFGFLGGGQVSVSDLLGNRYYHFLLSNSAQTPSEFLSRFNVAVTFVDLSHWTNLALGAFYFSNDYFDPYQAFYYEQTVGLRGGISVPLNVFDRFELSVSLWESRRKYGSNNRRSATLVANTLSLVHDNSLWSAIGPIDGWRLRVTVSPTFDLSRARPYNFTGLTDFRYYFHPNQDLTLAHRTMLLTNNGKDAQRFYIGGSWGLRGYPFNAVFGRKYALFNTELRFPFARSLILNTRSVTIGAGPFEGALFFDAGNAWESSYSGLLGSFGFGMRVAFGGTVLRWDLGKHTDFHHVQKGWFTQFFFGWDF